MNSWMRRYSWAVAMVVAIVITVGGLIILESGRQRMAQQYEVALEAKNVSAQLTELRAEMVQSRLTAAANLSNRPGVPANSLGETYAESLTRIHLLEQSLRAYYRQTDDPVAQQRFDQLIVQVAQFLAPIGRPNINDTAASAPGVARFDQQFAALLAFEQNRADLAIADSRADQRISTFSVGAVSALNIILFVLLFRNLGIQLQTQDRVQRQLLSQQEQLDLLVRERTRQLEALAWHLQSVSEDEKTQLARELHDELGAILTASKMDVTWVQRKLAQAEPQMSEKLSRALSNLDQGITLKRRIIEDMRPTVLANFGLVTALRTLGEEAAQRNGWSVDLDLPAADIELDEAIAIALFRVAQEALTNAAKYARAQRVGLHLTCGPASICLKIVDDGIGIAPGDLTRSKTHGLLGMRQRVAARGGVFEIRRSAPRGTEISVEMPWQSAKSESADTISRIH